jgi:MFS superfamily sulfate permease-like transporter
MNFRGISLKSAKNRMLCIVPVVRWLSSSDKSWLKFDLIAGLMLAAFAIPDNMTYATLAGLPPEYRL